MIYDIQHTSRDPILRIRSDLGEKLLSRVSRSSSPGSSILTIAEPSNVVCNLSSLKRFSKDIAKMFDDTKACSYAIRL